MARRRLWWLLRVVVLALFVAACGASISGCAMSDGGGTEVRYGPVFMTDATTPALYRYEATKEGSFEGDSTEVYTISGMPYRRDGDERYIVGLDGANILPESVEYAEALFGDVFVVRTNQPGPNNSVIVSLSEGRLVRKNVALAEPALSKNNEPRFVVVYYATEETEDEDDAVVYEHVNETSDVDGISVKYDQYSSDASKMYRGYKRVFDTQEGVFLDGVEMTDPDSYIYSLGDTVLVNEHGVSTLYDSKGKQLWRESAFVSPSAHSFCCSRDRTYTLYDSTGKARFSTDGILSSISGTGDYYTLQGANGYEIIDMDGKRVLALEDDHCSEEADGLFSVMHKIESSKWEYRTVDASGRTIVSGEIDKSLLAGYVTVHDFDTGTDTLLSGSEVLASGLQFVSARKMVISDADGNYYVFDDHECSLRLEDCEDLDLALVSGRRSGDEGYAVYDLFTGEAITPTSYDKIVDAGDHFFAHSSDEGVWDVYSVKRIPVEATKT